ncbi:MAG: hypothetical protein CO108_29500 [Deltaproteobacteria bacterium CG_4_9_14_3_um_filter_63_12]|nr:MAG: hypothetical protein CO108_29500 [Deltaproteobacteria bacterium CG_4_9_14_3_um_filter_63_12]
MCVLFAVGVSLGCNRASDAPSPKPRDASGSAPSTTASKTVASEVREEPPGLNEDDLEGTLAPLDVPLDDEAVADQVAAEMQDAAESPRDSADAPRPSLRTLMVEEIAPRFGVPEKRAELLELLDTLPTTVEEPQRERWRGWVQDPELRGSLAILCKRCHSEHASSVAGRER